MTAAVYKMLMAYAAIHLPDDVVNYAGEMNPYAVVLNILKLSIVVGIPVEYLWLNSNQFVVEYWSELKLHRELVQLLDNLVNIWKTILILSLTHNFITYNFSEHNYLLQIYTI